MTRMEDKHEGQLDTTAALNETRSTVIVVLDLKKTMQFSTMVLDEVDAVPRATQISALCRSRFGDDDLFDVHENMFCYRVTVCIIP